MVGCKRLHSAWVLAGFGLTLFAASGCSDSSSNSPTGPSNPASHVFTSSMVSGHSHTVTISKSEIETPPTAGISRQTSSSSGHTHNFIMSESQLNDVKGGTTATITTSATGAHSHTFSISKWY